MAKVGRLRRVVHISARNDENCMRFKDFMFAFNGEVRYSVEDSILYSLNDYFFACSKELF